MNWKNMTITQKIATVISGLAVAVWLIPRVKPDLLPVDPTFPAIVVFTISEAVIRWKQNRKWAYLLIAAAVVSLAFSILELTL